MWRGRPTKPHTPGSLGGRENGWDEGGAEAGTRTPMSVRSLRPEGGCSLNQVYAVFAFREVTLMASFVGVV